MNGFCCRILLSIIFLTGVVFAQEHHFDVRSLELPSKECYNIYQDSKGYVWISTVRGFCKYDGKSVVVFDRTKGLYENSVYSVAEDDKGRIWILTRNNRILYIENDAVHEPSFSSKFEKLNEFSLANFAHHMQFAHNYKSLIVYSFLNTYLINIESGEVSIVSNNESKGKIVELKYVDGKIGQSTPNSYGFRDFIDLRILDERDRELLYIKDLKVNKEFLHKVVRTSEIGSTSYFSFANILFCFDRKTKEIKKLDLDGRIICIYKDKSNGVWVGTVGSGVYYFDDGDISKTPIHSLRNYSISGLMQDSEGGIWASTLKKGVFYSSNKQLISYQFHDGLNFMGSSLSTFNDKVYVGTENFKLFEVDQLEVNEIKIGRKLSEFITDVRPYNNSIFIGNLFSMFQTDLQMKNVRLSKSSNISKVFPSTKMHLFNDSLYSALNNYLYVYNASLDRFEFLFKSPIKVRDIYAIDADRWLIGDKALVIYNRKTKTFTDVKGFTGIVSKILKLKNGPILISTVEAGLFKFENEQLVSLNDRNSKLPIVLLDMVEDESGELWLASNNGLIRYNYQKNTIKRFGVQDGLLSNEIQRLVICNDKLFLSTVEGLCSIPITSLKQNPIAPIIYFESSSFSGNDFDLRKKPTVNYSENNLTIRSRISNYSNRNISLSYILLLNGDTLNYETVNGSDLVLDNLSPGSYRLIMRAVNEDGITGNQLEFEFKIQPPFWKTSWFIVLMVLFLALFMYAIIKIVVNAIRIREEKKTHLNELLANSKLTALQAQMNPHFIFNAINSIQNFILKRDVNQAYDYLTKFSQLIRLVLQNSRLKETTLKEELKVLNLYITLEQLRFDNQFEYTATIEDSVDVHNIYIPPMLIQPILENAIWHGIMPLRGERLGQISLNIQIVADLLKITIEDNGVGRVTMPKDSIHESISMDVTQERLNIVNLLQNDNKAKFEVIDLVDEKGVACGTKVILYVPLEREE